MLLRIAAQRAGLKSRTWLVADAIESLASNGFKHPTVRMIALRAGISQRTTERALVDMARVGIIDTDRYHPGRAAIKATIDPLGAQRKQIVPPS